jgi:PIN domain nuclease of toxin-antitoxin system
MCLIRNEPGAEIVKAALPDSVICAVNLAEIIAKMDEFGMNVSLIATVLEPLQLDVIPLDANLAHASGVLRRQTRALGLSLGDRACLALASQRGATALTTDRAWGKLDSIATVKVVR